jgi:hypothetical protein
VFSPEKQLTSFGETSRAPLRWKIVAFASIFAFLLLLASIFAYAGFKAAFKLRAYDAPAVVTQVKQLDQLVTVRYRIQHVVGITEPKEPFGSESILLMVEGEALAGVDLANMSTGDIEYSGARLVTIALPPAKMLNTFLDEKQTKVWDRHITWWTPWVPYDPDLEHKARMSALENVRKAALSMGILAQAQKNAECAVQDFLEALGMHVTFRTQVR